MADESPVVRHHSLRHFKSNNPISDHQSDNLVSDEELSVGGTTPPPSDQRDDFPSPEGLKDEHRDINGLSEDEKDSVGSATNIIKFSIDNILNPEFGRMNAAESAAAVAFHTQHQQLIQQQQMNSPASAAGSFLGAFHQLPFLAAARQMILAATAAAGSSIDYHQQHLAAHHASVAAQAITHPHSHPLNSMLLAHQAQHHPTTLNLVESCTDKYLGGANNKSWLPHQPTPPGGALTGRSSSHPLSALASAAGAAGIKSKSQHTNKGHQTQTGSKAIDLSVRNSASPPDPLHRLTAAINAEKQPVPQDSPSLPSSAEDSSSASPVRSVSVSLICFTYFLSS